MPSLSVWGIVFFVGPAVKPWGFMLACAFPIRYDAPMTIIKRRELKIDQTLKGVHPMLDRLYRARGICSESELDRALTGLIPYQQLKGVDAAVDCLVRALEKDQAILIVGDFDADGATSSALAVRVLRVFGARRVSYLVPNRFEYGYGLTPEIVAVAAAYKPDLIMTVDNGIASIDGVLAAKKLGMTVVITDHHLAGKTLPEADAIVNPNQPGDTFPSKALAGVGVIFYTMLALRSRLREINWFDQRKIPEPNLGKYLDIVALGTVADVVPLDHNNRILVHQGLLRIRSGQCIPGIKALLQVGKRDLSRLVASDLGFVVGPRLNAAGRLDDMSIGIECLLTDDPDKALEIAEQLDALNHERRGIEQTMQQQAFKAIELLHLDEKKSLPMGLCFFDERWHQGVIGIVAARVKDKFHRPVIAFALANESEIKGSARSVSGVHIRDVLDAVATKNPGLITKFGGHAMAAGLSLHKKDFKKFSEAFDHEVSLFMTPEQLQHCLWSDGELLLSELSLDCADLLRDAGPWGQAFPEPLFDGVFELLEQQLLQGKHLKMKLARDGQYFDAIAFGVDPGAWPNHRCTRVRMAYRLDINEFRGVRKVQLMVEHVEPR